MYRLTANVVLSLLNPFTLMMEAICSSEMSVIIRVHSPEDNILRCVSQPTFGPGASQIRKVNDKSRIRRIHNHCALNKRMYWLRKHESYIAHSCI
jgi:hypothetical protein